MSTAKATTELQLARKYYDRWRLNLSRHSYKGTPFFTLKGQTKLAKCVRVVDGDTIYVVMRHHGEWQWKLRLLGINCPESKGRPPRVSAAEKAKGKEVKAYVQQLVLGKLVTVRFDKAGKYGRWLTEVQTEDGLDLASHLLERHMAVPYFGGTKPKFDYDYYYADSPSVTESK